MLHDLVVPPAAAGQRLDVWLESVLSGCTRSLISRLIKDGRCHMTPGRARAGYFLRGGEQVRLEVPALEPLTAVAEDIPLSVLHEDEDIIIIDKPAGMVVHPAIGHGRGTLVNALLGRYGTLLPAAPPAVAPAAGEDGALAAGEESDNEEILLSAGQAWRPGVVHRLDQWTSGLICVARTVSALTFLQQAFRERQVRKRYLALVAGRPRADFFEHAGWIGRHARDFRKRAVVPAQSPGGRDAYTSFLVIERHDGYTALEVRPRSGRTHQIRVHLAALGHAVLADATYGRSPQWPLHAPADQPALRRQALHAWTLDIPHPRGGRRQFQAPVPQDLVGLLTAVPSPRPWQ